jgi:hypothetical protein
VTRLEAIFGGCLLAGFGLVWIAEQLPASIAGLAWVVGGALTMLSVGGLILLGIGRIVGPSLERDAWRPRDAMAAARRGTPTNRPTARQPAAADTPGGPGTAWAPPLLFGKGRFVRCVTDEMTVSLDADLAQCELAVQVAFDSPGWEASDTDIVVDELGEGFTHVVRAPAGPDDADVECFGREPDGGRRLSPRVIVRASLRQLEPGRTQVTLRGACSGAGWGSGASWGERGAAKHLAGALSTLAERIGALVTC